MGVSSGANGIANGVVVAQVEVSISAPKKRKRENLKDDVLKSCCSIEITPDSLNVCFNPVSTQNDREFRIQNSSFSIKLCDSCQQLHNMKHFCVHCGMRCQLLDFKECAEGHRTHVDCVQLQLVHDECPHCDKKFIRTRTKQKPRPKANPVESHANDSSPFEFTGNELDAMKQIMIHYQDPKPVTNKFTSEQVKRAVDSSNYKLIAEVLKGPAESILQSVAKMSLFDYCLYKKRVDLAEVFLRFGLSPNKSHTDGIFSSLLEAAKNDDQRLVEYCLRVGVDQKRTDDNGRTAAHWAASTSSLATAKLLITPELIGVQDLTGFTCLHWALENPNFEVFDFVVKTCHAKDLYIADQMGSDKLGKTVLHWAAHYGFSQHCRALMERDENLLSARDATGATAIYYASQLEEDKAVRTLAEILPFFKEYASADQKHDLLEIATGRAKVLLLQIRQNIEVERRKFRKFKDRMVKWDIADAKESFPIHVFNGVDDSKIPSFTVVVLSSTGIL
jgi:ankyrin repeat protein